MLPAVPAREACIHLLAAQRRVCGVVRVNATRDDMNWALDGVGDQRWLLLMLRRAAVCERADEVDLPLVAEWDSGWSFGVLSACTTCRLARGPTWRTLAGGPRR